MPSLHRSHANLLCTYRSYLQREVEILAHLIWGQASETIDRIFSSYHFFYAIWKFIICSLLKILHPQSTFAHFCEDWIERNFTRTDLIILMLLVSLAWTSWKERNARLFLNKHKSLYAFGIEVIHNFNIRFPATILSWLILASYEWRSDYQSLALD